VPRARIAAMLWDRVSAAQARTSFRQALSELIGAMGPLAAELISTGRATVRLNTNACWVDALALLESSSSHASRTDLAVLCEGELFEVSMKSARPSAHGSPGNASASKRG
jgi:DNA-binding SARP family transcriptional activator